MNTCVACSSAIWPVGIMSRIRIGPTETPGNSKSFVLYDVVVRGYTWDFSVTDENLRVFQFRRGHPQCCFFGFFGTGHWPLPAAAGRP